MANAIVNRQVNVYINSGEAQKALDKLIAKEKLLKAELDKATDPKKISALNKELAKLQEPIDRATKKLKGELAPSFRELQAAAARAIAEFKKTGDPAMLSQYAKFNAELQKQKDLIDKANASQKGLTSRGIFSGAFWGSLAAGAITAVTSQLHNLFSTSINEALEADRVTAQLRNTLDNLGKTDAFDRIMRKADQMAARFKFLDNDEIVGVFNKLIDYGKLTEKQMNDLLPVIIDFAAKTRQDIGSATEVIITALEGNGKALKQFGINIKDAGGEAERLNEIMTTLKDKVDGAGEAFQNTAEGGVASARQEFENLKEDVGNGLIPILNTLLGVLKKVFDGFKILKTAIGEVLSGGTGFFQITVDKIREDKGFQNFVKAFAETDINTFKAIQKNLESKDFGGLGRPLTNSKEDQALLASQQQSFIQSIRAKREKALAALEPFKKNTQLGKEDAKQIRGILETIEASTQVLDAIDAILDGGTLGIKTPKKTGGKTIPDKLKEVNKELEKMKRFSEEMGLSADGLRIFQLEDDIDKRIAQSQSTKGFNDRSADVLRRNNSVLNSVFDSINRNNIAGLQLRIIQTHGKERLEAELALLKEQQAQELQQKDITENEKLLIEEKYRQARLQKETEYWVGIVNIALDYTQQALNIFSSFSDGRTNKENAELDADRRRNDTKVRNLKRQLDGKVITQLEYNRRVDQIQKEQDKKERAAAIEQFNRNKRIQIAQTAINTAQGIVATFAARPGLADIVGLGVARALQVGLIIATSAAQIAAINAQKPQFAKGGKLGGRSHSEGGNPILDGTGQKIGEIERGEGVINKRSMADGQRYTISGTPSQIASSINTLHGGVNWDSGATLIPAWRTLQPQRMNFAAMKKAYATGGLFQSTADSRQPTADAELKAMIMENTASIAQLNSILSNGIVAYSLLTQHEKQQARLNSIRNDATMKG